MSKPDLPDPTLLEGDLPEGPRATQVTARAQLPPSLLVVLPLFFLLGGCEPGGAAGAGGQGSLPGEPGASKPLAVLATTGMIGDMASHVGAPHVRVEALMGPGVDPHLYKASEGDVRRLSGAQVIFYNGLNLEGKLGDIFAKLSRSRRVVAVSDGVPREKLRSAPGFEGHHDPHIWFDVSLWALTIEPITRELSALDPEHAADFRRNADALLLDLKALDAWVEEQVRLIPAEQRVLVTAHDAFGYFGGRYAIDVVALQGISTVSEAAIRDVERVVDIIVSRNVKAIFVESSVPRKTIEAVQKACESRGRVVAIGGQLFSDAMGAAGTPEGKYRGMVEHNVKTIVDALR
ncbi:MAG TPA: zinc ABC transporter substrate-binding protein [Planctomycetota bacterium]|nr:zinc ABC transporter substrate-binding protein [Planctomycetota bacterium]